MSFITSQITRRGIVMAADRCATGKATLERTTGQREDFCVTISTTFQKIFATKNNIGISAYGDGTVNKTSLENCLFEFLEQLDTEKYRTPYEVANRLKDYFWQLDQNIKILFHVGGYDATGNIPVPALYIVATKERMVSKVNCDETYQGATFAGMTGIAGEIVKGIGSEYRNYNLRDAIEFARFLVSTDRQLMRFMRRGQAISEEIDILIIKPDGIQWIEG